MPYKLRPFTCPDCGVTVLRRRSYRAEVRCVPDAIAWAAEVARQLHARSGPEYDRWAVANAAAAQRALASAGPAEWPMAVLGHTSRNAPGGKDPGAFPSELQFLPKPRV